MVQTDLSITKLVVIKERLFYQAMFGGMYPVSIDIEYFADEGLEEKVTARIWTQERQDFVSTTENFKIRIPI